jgi:hypothetical protein
MQEPRKRPLARAVMQSLPHLRNRRQLYLSQPNHPNRPIVVGGHGLQRFPPFARLVVAHAVVQPEVKEEPAVSFGVLALFILSPCDITSYQTVTGDTEQTIGSSAECAFGE